MVSVPLKKGKRNYRRQTLIQGGAFKSNEFFHMGLAALLMDVIASMLGDRGFGNTVRAAVYAVDFISVYGGHNEKGTRRHAS